ncbi:MAG TPA: 4-(cytidine 5'-diphospho)-2-C-methyl-D-erythritol kinase [Bacteroidales bacterium]|nr:4-(cytidine 5'-diphospho)-2-C-methyl-D-erythritol kinase [Bacteroidales bacterium]
MICFPNAKINLGLRVTEKRPDGYHNLETVFYPIGLKDALEVVPLSDGKSYSLDVKALDVADLGMNDENNIVTKAFRLLEKHHQLKPAAFFLKKGIPTGAGLGGGSSDAANALRIINLMNGLGLSDRDLELYSAQIGADCAFFIKNKPIFATGIGTDFEEVSLNLRGYFLVLIKPDIHVSTAEAYSLVHPVQPTKSLKEWIGNPIETWRENVINDFERSVFSKYSAIGAIKEMLYQKGAVYASMSGSGSSVYGLFKSAVNLRADFPGCFYWSEMLN